MIVKDEVDAVVKIVTDALPYFDQIEIAVSDKDAWQKLGGLITDKKVTWWYREWNNRFDEARNYIQEKVNTDYWFWIDADDTFNFKAIPKLVAIADEGGYDEILLPYNYAQDEQGNCIAFHWRERLMRTSHPFTWKGWIHETPVTQTPYSAHRVNVPVVHANSEDHVKESLDRNHKILLTATAASDDPRYMMYLGTSFHARGEYGEAIEQLDKFNKVSGSVEDIYRSLTCMSECAYFMKHPTAAINYALQAAALIPAYPQAYWLLAQWEAEEENWKEALEWVKVSESKPNPEGMSVFDPSSRDRARLIAGQCEFMRKNYNNALKWVRRVAEDNPSRQDLEESFLVEADTETFVKMLPKIRKFFRNDYSLFDSLVVDLKYDVRLRGLRELVSNPKEWPAKSIVFLCGQGFEEWGPHTLDKGMGGSEEAIVYLSRELAKLGWQVTIYGAVDEKVIDGEEGTNVPVYLPWREFDRRDQFDVFVAWRAPEFAEHVNANVKLADIHDLLQQAQMKDYDDVTYFVKSNYHRNQYPKLADNKFRVIGNGIKKDQF
ncbi:Glycosyltransferase 2-like [uncultured Caudovirales phage]|uniref:Glycosyltransferase 2-like n=1 Tax=uncultured Caudovirales phage TaxID=2100421 RepID=A0A6J5QFS6_9CAUD|nr:Glycosyltransferase 2-like [uncultured Caudovirales phage]CAB4212429.1 Glycosyltransferase 2-like [uncultured Caudovirales phage]